MAKRGLPFHKFTHQVKGFTAKEGWALCVGAGTSLPLFPTWIELVNRLLQREDPDRSSNDNTFLLGRLTNIFEPDALIEAARDRLGLNAEDFACVLGYELYRDIILELGADWGCAARALSAASPGDLQKHHWLHFLEAIPKPA